MTGMIEWGQTSEPKNIPEPNINPQNKSHAEFPRPSLVVFYSVNHRATNLQIVLNTSNIPALINPPKRTGQISVPKDSESKRSNPKKSFNHSRQPGPGPGPTKMFQVRISRKRVK